MTLEDKINNEIEKHINYRNSFEKIQCAFSVEMRRNGQTYTCGGMSMMIKKDMNKRTDKIIKLVQQLR